MSAKNKFNALFGGRGSRKRQTRQSRAFTGSIGLELLEGRVTPTVTATFSAAQGLLTVIGDAKDNTIEISRNAAGTILVNAGAVSVLGGTATVANTKLIQVFGLSGNDSLSLNETNGALPTANIFG